MRTLFLDFDGVLHPEFCHESKHFCCLPAFEDVLRKAPGWSVVISSTWRVHKPLEQLRLYFAQDVAARVIGVTPRRSELSGMPESMMGYEREAECNAWLRANDRAACTWLALDDRAWLFRPFHRALFLVNGATGLTLSAAQLLQQRMKVL